MLRITNIGALILLLVVAGCSSGPSAATSLGASSAMAQSAQSAHHGSPQRHKMGHNTSCGSFTFASGDNGTYTVGIGNTCTMYFPTLTTCIAGVQNGYEYYIVANPANFLNTFGGGHLGDTSATFTRGTSGNVTFLLHGQFMDDSSGCSGTNDTVYGSVVLN